jgi:hypothetical protein
VSEKRPSYPQISQPFGGMRLRLVGKLICLHCGEQIQNYPRLRSDGGFELLCPCGHDGLALEAV